MIGFYVAAKDHNLTNKSKHNLCSHKLREHSRFAQQGLRAAKHQLHSHSLRSKHLLEHITSDQPVSAHTSLQRVLQLAKARSRLSLLN